MSSGGSLEGGAHLLHGIELNFGLCISVTRTCEAFNC